MRRFVYAAFGTVVGVTFSITSAIAEPPVADFEARLADLKEVLSRRCEEQHIPGLAVAVVHDGSIVMAEGFGFADVEGQRPVTEHTMFAIGSTTKAFTSTLIGMLVDDGIMSWDDPITRWMPELNLVPLPAAGADLDDGPAVTIRDMLSHRTGFTRMSILWASGTATREQIIDAAAKAEPWDTFRQNFHYNNIMYLAAGMAAGRAARSEYNALLTDRMLRPLEMTESNLTYDEMQQVPDHALGYQAAEDGVSFKFVPMRNIDRMAPAGAINSNLNDMTHWLQFLLDRGKWGDTRLVSEQSLAETWTPQIKVGPDAEYGLGWFIRSYQGARLFEHGGGIDGFTSSVAIFPDDHLGVVALCNIGGASLPGQVPALVYDTLILPDQIAAAPDERPAAGNEDQGLPKLEDYTGRYAANFGPFRDAFFTVSVMDDRTLAVDVPGQQNFELRLPGEDGRWAFVMVPEIAVSFDRDDAGAVVIMHLYQGGFEFELPREGYTPRVEIDFDDVQKYLGTYRADALNLGMRVIIQNHRLAVDVPGQMAYELGLPDENGRWPFRISDQIGVQFIDDNEDGYVESMKMYQGGQSFVLMHVRDDMAAADEPLPTVDDVTQLRSDNGYLVTLKPDTIHLLTGSIHFANAGVSGDLTLYFADQRRYRQEMMLGVFGHSESAVNDQRAEAMSSFQPYQELTGMQLAQAQVSHPTALLGPWDEYFANIVVLRRDQVQDRPVLVIRLEPALPGAPVPPTMVFIDSDNGRLLRSETLQRAPGAPGVLTTTGYDDYRTEFGITLPYRITVTNEYNGRVVMQFDRLEQPDRIESSIFTIRPLPEEEEEEDVPSDDPG